MGMIWLKNSILTNSVSIEEYTILKKLLDNRGNQVPREALIFALWGKYKKNSRIVDMHITNLRKKIEILKKHDKSCCGAISKSSKKSSQFLPFYSFQ